MATVHSRKRKKKLLSQTNNTTTEDDSHQMSQAPHCSMIQTLNKTMEKKIKVTEM